MEESTNIDKLSCTVRAWKQDGDRIAFVPTMGALHEGHLSLVRLAREKASRVIVSIFVNPTQFGEGEDFETYPRTIEQDFAFLESEKVDGVFLPTSDEMYPEGFQTYVINPSLSDDLCGASRPGHFKGVLTVVLKLLNLVQPDLAVFGLKDYQQFALIRTMVKDLCMPLDILGAETVRESSGLAMSSGNLRLSDGELQAAPALYKAMAKSKERFLEGERSIKKLIETFEIEIGKPGVFRIDYVSIREQGSLSRFDTDECHSPVMLCAAYLGSVRLIDNLCLS